MGNLLNRRRTTARQDQSAQPSRITTQDKAVLDLKNQRDRLQRYQKKITGQLEREREAARTLVKSGGERDKAKAKLLLRKKHYLEDLLNKTDVQLNNLDEMVGQIEQTQVEMQVLEGLKQGNACLEEMHKIMSLEDVEKIMAETEDAIEYQREIDALIGQNLSQEDEDAVLQELEDLLGGVAPAEENISAKLPDVPTGVPDEEQEEPAAKEKQKKEVVVT